MKHFKPGKFLENASLLGKLRALLISITILVVFAVLLTVSLVYSRYNSGRLLSQTGAQTDNAASSLANNLNTLEKRFISIIGTKDFLNITYPIVTQSDWYGQSSGTFQEELSALNNADYLVANTILVSPDQGRIFYSLNTSPRSALDSLFEKGELENVRGITLLSGRSNPFSPNSDVIPMVFPIRLVGNYFQLNLEDTPSDLYIVILLDADTMRNSLMFAGYQEDIAHYALLSSDGSVLYPSAPDGTVRNAAATVLSLPDFSTGESAIREDGRYIEVRPLSFGDLYLMGISQPVSFASILQGFLGPIINITLIIILITIILSIVFTNMVTRPIRKLLTVVREIEQGTYTQRVTFTSNDEVGQLMNAVNDMYDTIQSQIVQIREEESSKYRTELKLLTEQINPHFLYNTLEEIQSEVLRQDTETTTSMIQYLAEYLRIGLSGGSDLIPVSSEIRHAQAYVRIMNQRFSQKILFMYRTAPEISEHLILKTILQPLIENSIRHGFGIDASAPSASAPTIEVEIARPEDDVLTVRVSDNGSGFDEKQVLAIMKDNSEEARRHVGIHNVYQRLITYYGEGNIEVSAESIPYYQNTIAFVIHEGRARNA
jgi:two-component system sensor histidine kinase YesM